MNNLMDIFIIKWRFTIKGCHTPVVNHNLNDMAIHCKL